MTTLSVQPAELPERHRFTREQYYQMGDLGFFEGRRVELIDGEIVVMAPQKNPHYLSLSLTARELSRAFGSDFWVRTQAPLHLPNDSEPEPDVAVVPGPMESYKDHPTSALLVVEVADTTLAFDRTSKASLYASAGIRDYWVINVRKKLLEVMRDPIEDAEAPFHFRYGTVLTLSPTQHVEPLARPGTSISVATLLP